MAVPTKLLEQLVALDEDARLEIAHRLLKSVDDDVSDDMSDDERHRLEAALERSLAQADGGPDRSSERRVPSTASQADSESPALT